MLPPSDGIHTTGERINEGRPSGDGIVSLDISIQADARRLFHALTVPEYVETWLCVPGERPGCSTIASKNENDYVIEHFCEGQPAVAISGRYRVSRRRNVTFTWRVDGYLCVPESEVEIRLYGEFERTRVILRHRGFVIRYNAAWHRALWTGSLRRLAALYAPSDAGAPKGREQKREKWANSR